MVTISIDPYKTLGVDRDATLTEIRTSYLKLVLKCHPDKVEDPALKLEKQEEFQNVQGSYELLSDSEKRAKYDEKIRRDELRAAFAAASVSPQNTTTLRPPPKYPAYHNVNVRTAEPPRSFFAPNTTSSSSKMYAQTAPKSWEEIRVPDDLHKTARRTASYDERSSSGKREEERRRRRDLDEEQDDIDRDRRHWEKEQHMRAAEKEEHQRRERRAEEKEQRKAEKEEARRAEEKRLKKEKKKEKREAEEKKAKSRPYFEGTDDDGFSKSDKKKSSSSRSLDKDAEKPEKVEKPEKAEKTEKKEKERDRERERERERDSANRERSLSAQRRESAEEKHSRALEHAMNYIKTSQANATPGPGRANTYTSGISYVAPPPIVPMPPVDEEEVRRPTARARRGSQESRTKEKLSSKKGPTLDPLADETPYIVVDAVPPPLMPRHNLPRANTATDREFTTRKSAEIPMPSPPRRAETFHYGNSEREAEPRGRNRSRHQPQVSEEDESEDDYRREPKTQSRLGSRARSPEMAAPRDYPYTTVYTVNDGRSRREGSFRASPERNFSKPAYTYVQPPVTSGARVVEPRNIDPRSREGYAVPSSKIRVGKHYTKDDINYGPGYQEGWNGVRA